MKAKFVLVPLIAALAVAAHAQVTVSDSWVRGTVAQQKTSGLFFKITSATPAKLVAVSTPVAKTAELHSMEMKGDVMSMHPVSAIELLPGKTVSLEPGGYHVMLMGLLQPLNAGQTVPATLTIEDAKGQRQTVQVQARVEALGAPHVMPPSHAMSGSM